MATSPSRISQDQAESGPLLSPSDRQLNGTSPPSASTWQFWKPNPKPTHHVSFAALPDSDDEDEQEHILPISTEKKRRRRRWERYMSYGALVVAGGLVGAVLMRGWDVRGEKGIKGDGPMVPPVYTLPPPTGLPRNPAYLIEATTAAVASEDITCSNLGLSILRDKNGTAVDAAITTTLCIGLLNAFSSGIGGGGFMTIRIPPTFPRRDTGDVNWDEVDEGGVVAIDFRETSPEKSEQEMYGTKKAGRFAAQVGGLSVAVPGELRGLEAAHRLYGSLRWEEVVMPVAELAQNGWSVSRELARRLRIFGGFMLDNPTWSAVYAPTGYLLVEGDYIKRTHYGQTLEKIAKHGASAFYTGEIAASTVNTLQSLGGVMTLKDLSNFKAISYPAIHQTYHNKTLYTTSAPSSGGIMLAMLNILEPYGFNDPNTCFTPLMQHRLLEAMKFAFGARSEITDPAFVGDKEKERFEKFYSKEWADEIRGKINDNKTHDISYYGLLHDTPVDHGTTHLSVVDGDGGAASVTSTVNLIWGSHVMDPKTGVIFNDEQDDFAVPGAPDAFGLLPSPWNYPLPNKKPLSSTSPTIILHPNNTLHSVLGGSGGSRIFGSVVQVLLNLDCGLDLKEAVDRPRVHNQVVPIVTTLEVGPEGEDEVLEDGLKDRGHEVGVFDINLGISEIQAILIEEGKVWATSDSRKNGIAAGY